MFGSTSLIGSDSDCAFRCSNVSTAWLLDTWPSSADLSPASTDTGIYDLLAVHGQLDVPRVRLLTCGLAPGYLGPFTRVADLPSRRSLRSIDTDRLVVPYTSRLLTVTVGSRAFSDRRPAGME